MTTKEKELWAKVINDARWYDGTPQMLNQLTEHFEKQGIVVKNCSIPDVVEQSEQFKCAMQLSKSGKRCDKQCIDCELSYKNYSI